MTEMKYIFLAGGITILARFLPRIIFRNRELPGFIAYLGEKLPYSLMGLLLVFCIRGVDFTSSSEVLPLGLAFAGIILSFKFFKNFLVSIFLGTGIYMALIYFL